MEQQYATEACRRILKYGFEEKKDHRIVAGQMWRMNLHGSFWRDYTWEERDICFKMYFSREL